MNKKVRLCVTGLLAVAGLTNHAMALDTGENVEDMVYMLSHIICGEVEDCDKQMKEYVGSVVLNRIGSDAFPDTMAEVIFQPGQYAPTWDGNYYKEPGEETIAVAKDLIENGSKLPEDVVFQAEFIQGSGVYTSLLAPNGVTEYFCYG